MNQVEGVLAAKKRKRQVQHLVSRAGADMQQIFVRRIFNRLERARDMAIRMADVAAEVIPLVKQELGRHGIPVHHNREHVDVVDATILMTGLALNLQNDVQEAAEDLNRFLRGSSGASPSLDDGRAADQDDD